MDLQSGAGGRAAAPAGRGRRARWSVSGPVRRRLAIAVLAAALVAIAALLLAGRNGSVATPPAGGGQITAASPAGAHRALISWLRSRSLDFHSVICVRNGFHYEGVAVVRCNVDFGEPHIVAYCAVLRGARLLTSAADPAIPCGSDNVAAGSATIVTYG